MKSKRHEKILELIRDHDIETQEQLLQQLQESGFNTTQATIPGTSSSCASSRSWDPAERTATARRQSL